MTSAATTSLTSTEPSTTGPADEVRVLQLDVVPAFGDIVHVAAGNPVLVLYRDGLLMIRIDRAAARLAPAPSSLSSPSMYEAFQIGRNGMSTVMEALEVTSTAMTAPDVGDAPAAADLDVTRIALGEGSSSQEVLIEGAGVASEATGNDSESRAQLEGFLSHILDPVAWLGPDMVTAVSVSPRYVGLMSPREEAPPNNVIDWPLLHPVDVVEFSVDLVVTTASLSCLELSGNDVERLGEAAAAIRTPTWVSNGQLFVLALRPLLPDESDCHRLRPSAGQ